MRKIIFLTFISLKFLFSQELTLKNIENPTIVANQVIKVFKQQIKKPITDMYIKVPYNINYSVSLNGKVYYVAEFKIKIMFKTTGAGLITEEKNYIIRFLIDVNTEKVIKEEIYSLTLEKEFKENE